MPRRKTKFLTLAGVACVGVFLGMLLWVFLRLWLSGM